MFLFSMMKTYFCPYSMSFIKRTIPNIICIILIISQLIPISAQTDNNPFELQPRIRERLAAEQATIRAKSLKNPFDIIQPIKPIEKPAETSTSASANVVETINTPISPSSKSVNVSPEKLNQFIFLALLIQVVLITLLFLLFRNFIGRAWRSFLNDNLLTQLHREQGHIAKFPYLLLNLVAYIGLGLLAILLLHRTNNSLPISASLWIDWFFFSLGFAGIFIGKHLLLKIVGSIFPVEKEIRLYAFMITIFTAVLGLFSLPINTFLAYLPENISTITLYSSLIIIGLFYLFRSLRALVIGSKYLASNLFHFLLYICAVEIAPMVILLKILAFPTT